MRDFLFNLKSYTTMESKIIRVAQGKESTLSQSYINGVFQCYLLEDKIRTKKIPTKTAIPEGTYKLKLNTNGAKNVAYKKAFGKSHNGMIEILGLLIAHPQALQTLSSVGVVATSVRDTDQTDRRIDRVVRWIHENLSDDLTIEAASAKVHVSPAAFSRFFKRSLGKTFTEYVNDLRCTEAAIQLRKTDKPIANVAQECGFATLSHFNRQFLLRHGQTPRHYRKAA